MLHAVVAVAVIAQPQAVSPDGTFEPVRSMWAHPTPVAHDVAVAMAGCNAFLTTNQDPEGDMPRELVITPDGTTALIVNRDTDTVTYLDLDTQSIVATVDVGDFPVSIDVTPDGTRAFVANVLDNTVSVIDVAAKAEIAQVPVGGDQPYRVHATDDQVVVGIINDAVLSAFSIIDVDTLTETDVIPSSPQGVIGGFFTPESGIFGNIFTKFDVSPDGSTIVLPDRGNDRVTIYDVPTASLTADIPTTPAPTAVDIASDGSFAVITHEGNNQAISVIDLGTNSIDSVAATGADLFNQIVKLTPDGTHAMAAILNNMIFVDLAAGVTSTTISTGSVGDIEVSSDGQYAFVSNVNARTIDIASQSVVDIITGPAGAETAASPVENRVVVLNNRFAEDANVYNIDGAGGFFEGGALSGEIEEGDATRAVSFSPDGNTAVACNLTSRNVSIIDMPMGADVRSYVDTGDRCWDVKLDNETAVVTNTETGTVSVIDLTTDTSVATLNTPGRPTELELSSDGTRAYVTTVTAGDRVWFIDVDGADSQVTGTVPAGQLGSIIYTYNVASGIALSPDDSLLAVCVSFDDILKLIDTQTEQVLVDIPIGDFPIRAAFNADSTRLYVTNSFGDSLDVIEVDGANSELIATVPGIEFPLTVTIDDDYAYVGSFDFNTPSIRVVDLGTNTLVGAVFLNDRPRAVELADGILHVATTGGELVRIEADGPGSSIIDTETLSGGPSDLALDPATSTALAAQPGPDGVDVVRYGPSADCNDDGELNILDFVCFQLEWQDQTDAGDCDNNGLYNILDFVCFQEVFVQGCP